MAVVGVGEASAGRADGPVRAGIPEHGRVPRYYAVKVDLLLLVAELGEGTMLPSERDLAERYGVSRLTMRQAVGELVLEGRLVRRQGSGTYVSRPKFTRPLGAGRLRGRHARAGCPTTGSGGRSSGLGRCTGGTGSASSACADQGTRYGVPVAEQRDGAPIWARPEPGARRPRFSREQIAAAALAIADSEGFAAVSMRRVAAELGAGTMTLYHYVRTKDDLVALMDDSLMAEALIPDAELPTGWRAAMTAVAHRTRAALVRHPWALVSLRDAQMGPNAMRHFEQSLKAISATDLDVSTKLTLLTVVDDYVMGHVLRLEEIAIRTERAGDDATAAGIEFGLAQLATGQFPWTSKLYEENKDGAAWRDAGTPDAILHRFDLGLAALLDGLAVRLNLPPD